MKTHLKHRFSNTKHLEMMEYSSTHFSVSYLTMEGHDENGREMWFSNNSDDYSSYSDAIRAFNKRRESSEPWRSVKK